ncbi:hypothetical protein EW146_g6835 [Bondarzewia mesenterica]|uniref:Uncharacterized protein n=1 Tax=Bondarzewia mesenterica TaxID=1095465 RepID=A0A4S4LN85_9AGAM|nr:hypothetical protein EW146_g6835 [Bondarzewia mesenterica]
MSPFLSTFYRDSIMFYIAIFRESSILILKFSPHARDARLKSIPRAAFTLGNVIVFLTAPDELLDLLDTLTRVFHSILCCRILLHLRSAGAQEAGTTSLFAVAHGARSNISTADFGRDAIAVDHHHDHRDDHTLECGPVPGEGVIIEVSRRESDIELVRIQR